MTSAVGLLAQCFNGGCGPGDPVSTSGIPPVLGLAIVLGFSFLIYVIWQTKGATIMNRMGKIVLVVGLAVAVGAVFILKQNRASVPASQPSTQVRQELPRLVDLGSSTCIPCKQMTPILAELKAEYQGRMQVDFIDVNVDPKAALPFGIRIIPTQIFMNASGKELFRHEGFIAKEDILAKWQELGVNLNPPATQKK